MLTKSRNPRGVIPHRALDIIAPKDHVMARNAYKHFGRRGSEKAFAKKFNVSLSKAKSLHRNYLFAIDADEISHGAEKIDQIERVLGVYWYNRYGNMYKVWEFHRGYPEGGRTTRGYEGLPWFRPENIRGNVWSKYDPIEVRRANDQVRSARVLSETGQVFDVLDWDPYGICPDFILHAHKMVRKGSVIFMTVPNATCGRRYCRHEKRASEYGIDALTYECFVGTLMSNLSKAGFKPVLADSIDISKVLARVAIYVG